MRSIRFAGSVSVLAVSALLAGCGSTDKLNNLSSSSAATTTATMAAGGAATVYAAVDNSTPVVVGYSAATSGTPIPSFSFNVGTTTDVEAIGVDKSTGTVYVTGYSYTDAQPEIWAYSSTASGAATPVRTIQMGMTATTEPLDLTVDASGNVYVATQDTNSGLASVVEYGPTATGAATPVRTISGTSTGIVNPLSVTVDSAGTVYVSSYTGYAVWQGTILEFASSANGNVAPLRTITASSGQFFFGLATDASLNLYAVQESYGQSVSVYSPSIAEFAAGASGAASPTKVIASPALTLAGGLQVDSVGNLYAVNFTSSGANLLGFGPGTGSANVNPGLTLTPTALNTATTTSIAIH